MEDSAWLPTQVVSIFEEHKTMWCGECDEDPEFEDIDSVVLAPFDPSYVSLSTCFSKSSGDDLFKSAVRWCSTQTEQYRIAPEDALIEADFKVDEVESSLRIQLSYTNEERVNAIEVNWLEGPTHTFWDLFTDMKKHLGGTINASYPIQ